MQTVFPTICFRQATTGTKKKTPTFTKSKGGWQCGKSFIPKKSKCYTDPVTGKKLKEPTTYSQYRKKRAESIKRQEQGLPLTDKEKVYLGRVERDRQKLQQKKFESAAKSVGASKVLPGGIASVDPSKIEVDPKRFQYKLAGSNTASGTVGSLRGVKKWDANLAGIVQVWADPSNKKVYVVNGHNRLELEKKLGVPQRPARFLEAKTAKEARAIGALTNIAEGRGNAKDAAKFFRDSGISKEDLEKRGIPLREKIATDGLAMSRLSDGLFNQVVQGELPESRAVIIGDKLKDRSQQEALVKLIAKEEKRGRKITNDVIEELADMTSTAPKQQGETNLLTMLGFDPDERSLSIEKAQVSASIKRQLNKDKKLFGTVGKGVNARQLKRGGNQINVEESAQISQNASTTLTLFEKQKNNAGKIDNILNESAKRLADGESREKVTNEARKAIEEHLQESFKYGRERESSRAASTNNRRLFNTGAKRRLALFKKSPTHYYQTRNGKKVRNAPCSGQSDLKSDFRTVKVKYTKPKLRAKLKKQIQASDKGGKPGQWSARKSQLLASEYKKAGGGYRGNKTKAAKSLDRWTSQKWRTKDKKPAIRDGYTTRYLPDKEWEKLSDGEAIATIRKKIKGSKKGEQFVANTKKAKQASEFSGRSPTLASFSKNYYYQTRNGKRVRVKKNKDVYGGWWSNRTTATVVSAKNNSAARSKIKSKHQSGYGKLKKVALLSDRDAELARKGKWVRTRIDGKSPAQSNQKSKYRSWLN